jgi:xanthine dehydrogenase small subunit
MDIAGIFAILVVPPATTDTSGDAPRKVARYRGGNSDMSDVPRILLNGVPTSLDGVPPAMTLLDWLRDHANLRGTKEGCAEGDCGACTVVVERRTAGSVERNAINACLTMLGQLDGAGVRTIEGLSSPSGALHPVQSAFVATGGTQCGFCTPGFIMSAYAFAIGGEPAEPPLIHDALAGNLCRCTGYRPIVEAVARVAPLAADPVAQSPDDLGNALAALAREGGICFAYADHQFHVPQSLAEASALRARLPQAQLLAGGTDLGLLASRQREALPQIIYLGNVAELNRLDEQSASLAIGAAVTYARAFDLLTKHYPQLRTYLTRLGSRQIRSMGTIGGNIGTASPIGDFLPVLLALDAKITVHSAARGTREIAADTFFTGYRQTAMAADEIIVSITLPKLPTGAAFFVDKISKRRDQDISSVCGAYRLTHQHGVVRDIRLAFGGLAATPKRARQAEGVLLDQAFTAATFDAAATALFVDFAPIGDWRASAAYRRSVAKNLLHRLRLRIAEPALTIEVDAL